MTAAATPYRRRGARAFGGDTTDLFPSSRSGSGDLTTHARRIRGGARAEYAREEEGHPISPASRITSQWAHRDEPGRHGRPTRRAHQPSDEVADDRGRRSAGACDRYPSAVTVAGSQPRRRRAREMRSPPPTTFARPVLKCLDAPCRDRVLTSNARTDDRRRRAPLLNHITGLPRAQRGHRQGRRRRPRRRRRDAAQGEQRQGVRRSVDVRVAGGAGFARPLPPARPAVPPRRVR